jgi:hypothetical protein
LSLSFVCNALVDLKQRSIDGLSPCKHQLLSSSLDGCLSAPPATQVFTAPILADAANGVFSTTQFIREVTHCKLMHGNAAAIGVASLQAA